jgi:hypothetical protein
LSIKISWTWVNPYDGTHLYAVPQRAGVYEVMVKLKNSDRYRREYVGQSADLHGRAAAHLTADEPNACLRDGVQKYVCAFRYALLASEADRLDAEQALYDKYQHPCNSSRPPGSGRSPRPPVEEE